MDRTLLEQTAPTETVQPPPPPPRENNSEDEPVVTGQQQQYRDIPIELPSLPVRMKFDTPIDYDGEKYTELVCDFDSLIGKDFQRIEREFVHMYKAEKNETPLPELKHLYHCLVIARAADVPVGLIFKLPRRYYTPIRLEALKACGSSPDEVKA